MGSRVYINTAKLCLLKPGGLVADDADVGLLGDVAADGVERQGRRILLLTGQGSVRNQTKLNQCLEAVADTKNQTIAVVQKIRDLLTDLLIPEAGCKELRTAVRLISCGEAAGEHNHLCL